MRKKASQRNAAVMARYNRLSLRRDNQIRMLGAGIAQVSQGMYRDHRLVTPRHPIPIRGWVITAVITTVFIAGVMAVAP